MGSPAPASPLRQMLEGQLSQLSAEVERLFDEARGRARRELADQLNLSVRRIRHAASLDELAATLLDAAGAFAAGAAILRISGGTSSTPLHSVVRGEKIRGVAAEPAAAFAALEIPLASAPALASAVESRDPVVAVTAAGEVSAGLVAIASHAHDGRAHIYPLAVKDRVPVLLYCWGVTQGAALEMLAQVSAAVWDSLMAPEPPPPTPVAPELVTIAPAPPAAPTPVPVPAPASTWDALSPGEQAIHLRAQRFARVQVAEMRLNEAAAVQSGRAERDLYGALRAHIDGARAKFRESFFARSSSMVDYIHVELVRTLAHDDADLLGKDYPGPLV
jgi:hypothetical protein